MIENTQTYQARLVALTTESYRRQHYQPMAALFHSMFVETWPPINWGVVDYLHQPEAGYYALQRAHQPILPSIEPVIASWRQGSPATVRLWAINDTWATYENCRLTWQVRQDGQISAQGETSLALPPDVGQMVKELTVIPAGPQPVTIVYRIDNHRGKHVDADQHTELAAVAQAGRRRWGQSVPRSVVGFHPQTAANKFKVKVFHRFANIT